MSRDRSRTRGSVLMLMPAAVLVVLMLAAISVDLSLVFLRQRQASSVAVDIANDLASAAFDHEAFRATGHFTLDEARARRLGRRYLDASDLAGTVTRFDVEVLAPDAVRVAITVRVDYLFAKAIPGAADGTTVTAHATATAVAS